MTYDEAERLVLNAGHYVSENGEEIIDAILAQGAADERERIAKMFDGVVWAYDYRHIAEVIRSGDDPPINTRKGED